MGSEGGQDERPITNGQLPISKYNLRLRKSCPNKVRAKFLLRNFNEFDYRQLDYFWCCSNLITIVIFQNYKVANEVS